MLFVPTCMPDEEDEDDECEPADDGGLPVARRSSDPSGPRSSSSASAVTWRAPSQLCGCRSSGLARARRSQAPGGRIRERVVEGRERVRAGDVELELLVEPGVGDRDLDAVGRLAPEERDLEAVAFAARELSSSRACASGELPSISQEASSRPGAAVVEFVELMTASLSIDCMERAWRRRGLATSGRHPDPAP